MSRSCRLLLAAGLLLLGACATPPPPEDAEALAEFRAANDPAEPLNRTLFAIDRAADRLALRPLTIAYREVVPEPARQGVRNLLRNLRTPVTLMNDMLQGEPRRAGDTLGRFLINTTLGLGGLIDVADAHFGVPYRRNGFGTTLALWGVEPGPYLYLPLLGPYNPRDALGFGVDVVANPLAWFGQGSEVMALDIAWAGMTYLDQRDAVQDQLDEVERTSLDPYATIRAVSQQQRAAEIDRRRAERRSAP
ncbi:MAG: VacJ family lipoprotein [Rhodovarius sp.]|nr:VacJ family lipoprotein [Rhodovarius sp.]